MSLTQLQQYHLGAADMGFEGDTIFRPYPGGTPSTPISVPPDPGPAPTPTPTPTPGAPVSVVVTPPPTPRAAPTVLPVPPAINQARYTLADYLSAAIALLPRGRVWSTDPSSVQAQILTALIGVIERIDAAGNGLLLGSLPGSISPMLPEWESTLGLPDPCLGGSPSFADRATQVLARFVGTGGLSAQRYINFAAALGFTISVQNYAPFQVGVTQVGNPVNDDSWAYVWSVKVLSNAGGLSTDVLMCELDRVKPAETTIFLHP